MRISLTIAAALTIAVGVFTPTALADGDGGGSSSAAPLTGESLLGSELGEPGTSTVQGTCDPLGTSTFTFTVTGTAFGPYPGTFTESGTVTVEPLGAASSFESTFTINSPLATVNGSKSLAGAGASALGLCGTAAFPTGAANALAFEGTVSYEATIATSFGTSTDSGESFVSLQDSQIRGRAGFNGFNFVESYTSTAAVPCDVEDDDDEDDDDDDGGELDCGNDEDEDEDDD